MLRLSRYAAIVRGLGGIVNWAIAISQPAGKRTWVERVGCIACVFGGLALIVAGISAAPAVAQTEAASDVRLNYTLAELHDRDFSGQNFQGSSFAGADARNANFHGADLRGAILTKAAFFGADLSDADLSETLADRVTFDGANLTNA
ncbi:MAG: pentapeptide repeat-containing protein, partial [Spirulinaceae cyanobacterium RM2_2_10]|nr:pentapeptide repeat-containing protein [Spirulinaceae cyanobacterium RM2_2_10]